MLADNDHERVSVVSLASDTGVDSTDDMDEIPSIDAILLGYDKTKMHGSGQYNGKAPISDDTSMNSHNVQQQNDIIAMFSGDEDSHDMTKDSTSDRRSLSQDTAIRGFPKGPSAVHYLDDDGSSNASHMGFIDEESARNYQRILANRKNSESASRSETTNPVERGNKGAGKRARLRAQYSTGDSEQENSDFDQDAIKSTQGIVRDDHGNKIGDIQGIDWTGIDMPDTDSETERMPRKGVLVIHGSSEESDNDFISETEELYPTKVQPVTNTRLEKFLSVFEPKRRKQMHQKLEMKNVLAGKHGDVTPDLIELPQHPTKIVRGYSDELDDDLADFIVDEEESVDGNESELDIAKSNNDRHVAGVGKRKSTVQVLSDGDLLSDSDPDEAERDDDATMAQLPEQFSQFDLPTSFKTYVQYLVYWLCNGRHKPELSDKNAKYFFFAYITIARVIDSVEQSLVESSAWVDSFRRDLHRYPEIHFSRISAIEGCDACHFRKNRTATFCLGLFGKAYDREELVPPRPGELVATDSSEMQDNGRDSPTTVSDDEDSDIEAGAFRRKRSAAEFNVGKICKQRAETGHELHHYFYHLAHLVEISLSTLSFSGHNNGVEAGSWNLVDPDDLVEMLDGQGMVGKLFIDFKALLSRSKSGFAS
ncbi:hypothetical protein GGI23_003306 [Coemansia sp. RSA 2559]|nr:hypothetical protein GGI23_003306 [Coemansia sp. RSA 2559]